MTPALVPRQAERHVLHLPVFEGPLDLLLYLIRKQELDITDIPIAEIAEQYSAYLRAMEELSLEIASEYIVMLATLIHIKSRMILPRLPLEEEDVVEDPRQELVERLLEYERYKKAAGALRRREEESLKTHVRSDRVLERYPFEAGVEATAWDLALAFQEVLSRRKERGVAAVEGEEHRVEDKAQAILFMLREQSPIAFRKIFEKARSLVELLVYFLALLELMRQKKIRAQQGEIFGEILLYSFEQGDMADAAH
ncbi:MAG: segregation/condensation protein A [Acidobacteriota bacterium]|nr:MAG: segregation/condensation protein A [Acidobacteriota bacterium]